VLPLTAAYELEWSQDCGRMRLKSAVMDSIGVQRAAGASCCILHHQAFAWKQNVSFQGFFFE
jgi:hypothetical protein